MKKVSRTIETCVISYHINTDSNVKDDTIYYIGKKPKKSKIETDICKRECCEDWDITITGCEHGVAKYSMTVEEFVANADREG